MSKKTKVKTKKIKNERLKFQKEITKKEGIESFISRGVNFLKEVKIEAKKITWPQRKQVLLTAIMIAMFSLFIGAYLSILDVIYNSIISLLIK